MSLLIIVRLWMPGLDQESSHPWRSRTTRVQAAASTSPPSSPRRCTPTTFPAPSTTCQVLQYRKNHSVLHLTSYIMLQGVCQCQASTSWMNRKLIFYQTIYTSICVDKIGCTLRYFVIVWMLLPTSIAQIAIICPKGLDKSSFRKLSEGYLQWCMCLL